MRNLDELDTGEVINSPGGPVANFPAHVFRIVARGMDWLDPANRQRFLDDLPRRTDCLRKAIIAEAEGREPGYSFTYGTAVCYDNQEISDKIFDWLDEAFADEIKVSSD